MDPLFEVELDLPPPGTRGALKALYAQLKAAIEDGRLAPGARMPPTRRSEAFFGVSRNTAADVYERLVNEGYLVSRRGSGAYVAARLPTRPRRQARTPTPPDPRLNPLWSRADIAEAIGFWRDPEAASRPGDIDFRPALVDPRLFPFDEFRQASAKELRALETRPARFKSPQGNSGSYRLREAVTRHIAVTRAVACSPDEIVVTSGAQQAFDLLARTLVRPGETTVAVEDPGYPPMRAAFLAAGAQLHPVSVDAEGLIVEGLPAEAKVICVCPSHEFPLGVALSPQRRKALIVWARKHGAVIVEDDYDGEFRFEGGPLEALRTEAAADVVFYVGTFSKCMLPALRVGFVVAPDWAMPALVAAKNCMDWHCSTPLQLSVAAFIADGRLTRHVRRMREVYRRRREALIEGLEARFAERLEPIASFYGMHVAAFAHRGYDAEGAARAAAEAGVKVHSLDRYYLGSAPRSGLVFGYGAADEAAIGEGLKRLAKA